MDTITVTRGIIYEPPMFSGFESRIYLHEDSLMKIFYDKVTDNKLAKIEILSKIDEDIIKPKSIVLDRDGIPFGYTMDYKKDYKKIDMSKYSESHRIEYLKLLKEKLDILHKHDIVFADIKSSNILVNGNSMYLCDLDNTKIGKHKIDILNAATKPYTQAVTSIDETLDNYMYNVYVLKMLLGFKTIDYDVLHYLYDSYYKRWEYDIDFKEIIYNMMELSEENKHKVKMLLKMDKKK